MSYLHHRSHRVESVRVQRPPGVVFSRERWRVCVACGVNDSRSEAAKPCRPRPAPAPPRAPEPPVENVDVEPEVEL